MREKRSKGSATNMMGSPSVQHTSMLRSSDSSQESQLRRDRCEGYLVVLDNAGEVNPISYIFYEDEYGSTIPYLHNAVKSSSGIAASPFYRPNERVSNRLNINQKQLAEQKRHICSKVNQMKGKKKPISKSIAAFHRQEQERAKKSNQQRPRQKFTSSSSVSAVSSSSSSNLSKEKEPPQLSVSDPANRVAPAMSAEQILSTIQMAEEAEKKALTTDVRRQKTCQLCGDSYVNLGKHSALPKHQSYVNDETNFIEIAALVEVTNRKLGYEI